MVLVKKSILRIWYSAFYISMDELREGILSKYDAFTLATRWFHRNTLRSERAIKEGL